MTKIVTSSKTTKRKRRRLNKKGKALLHFLISLAIITTSCNISKNTKKTKNNNEITAQELISKKLQDILEETDTEKSILYENSLNTIMYYNDNLDCNSTLYVGRTIEDLDKLFHESLDNNNIKDANTYLYCMIYLIMECQLTDALNINIDESNMVYFDINCDKNYLSIIKDTIYKEKKYYLDGKKLKKAAYYLQILSNGDAQYKSNDEYDIEYIYNNVAKEISQKTGKISSNIFTKKKMILTNK